MLKLRIRALCAVAPLALVALVPAAAHAGVGASAVPSFPPVVTVGAAGIPASIELRNTNTGANVADVNTVCNAGDPAPCPAGVRGIVLIPACAAQGPDAACTQAEPGVFAISPTATGAAGTACAGTIFDTVVADAATGLVRFTPRGPRVTLPGAGAACRIEFTFAVLKSPAFDQDPALDGVQTVQVAENAQHNGALPAFARGTSVGVTVLRAQPSIATVASPTVQVGGRLTDTARVSGLVSPVPGATVSFRLYAPGDVACAAAPLFESLNRPLAADGTATSLPFTATAAGVYRWRAFYNGDANNAPVAGACNAAGETVTVTPPPPPPPPPPPVVSFGGPPEVTVRTNTNGGPCVKTAFKLRISVDAEGLKGVKVKLDGRTIKTTKKAKFTLRVRAFGLAKGRHRLKIIATGAGGRTVQRATFFRCKRPAVPRFVG
jgi:hypothetical protein